MLVDRIEKVVNKRIKQGYDYLQTLRTLKGADPREVWEHYKGYKTENAMKQGIKNSYPAFPEPHSAFSQWRLTKESSGKVIEKIREKGYTSLCFLGCPILGNEHSKDLGQKVLLLDVDRETLNCVKSGVEKKVYDAYDNLPNDLAGKFSCVITDAPWYLQDIKLFIVRASQAAKQGGTIFFTTPGLLTRPSIVDERLEMQKWLSENNLIIDNISEVEYETPAFEYMAYYDIPAFSGENWRVGSFVKLKKAEGPKDINSPAKEKTNWLEYKFDEKRVLLREIRGRRKEGTPKVEPVNEDESLVLKTVSRRSTLIPKIDLWSSRNAVLHIASGYSAVKDILENPYEYSGRHEEAAEQIRSFIAI